MNVQQCAHILQQEGLVVARTDTVYGILAVAHLRNAVEKVYQVKKRNPEKPCIILISDQKQLTDFGITLTLFQQAFLDSVWPGPVSVIMSHAMSGKEYLDRGTQTLAFRLPKQRDMQELIDITGPLIAPSANPEGKETAQTIEQAKNYFGHHVDYYDNGGTCVGDPSTLAHLFPNDYQILRGTLDLSMF